MTSYSLLNPIITSTNNLLQTFALNEGLNSDSLALAFGNDVDVLQIQSLEEQFGQGNFTALPTVEIRSTQELGGALGAYATELDRIFISQEFISTATEAEIIAVLLEEFGHSIDARINTTDSAGDEGFIFSSLVRGVTLTAEELESARQENDQIEIIIDGQVVSAEAAIITTDSTGGGQAIENRQPYGVLNYAIALQGIFPSSSGSVTGGIGEAFLGEIIQFAGNFAPRGYALADGQLLPIASNSALFSLLGTTYGGDGRTTFALPDLRGRAPVGFGNAAGLPPVTLGQKSGTESITLSPAQLPAHTHNVGSLVTSSTGASQPINNNQPTLGLTPLITTQGLFQELGQVRWWAGNFAPGGTAIAQGQILPISGNEALFSVLGTTYGGDGRTTFALPDLRGRVAVDDGSVHPLGDRFGSANISLTTNSLPAHNHSITTSNGTINTNNTGNGQSFSNEQPSLALNYQIATQGIFPSRSLEAEIEIDGDGLIVGEELLDEISATSIIQNLAQEGIARWKTAGIGAEKIALLEGLTYQLDNLDTGYLASVDDFNLITIDIDASNTGWFVDHTPWEDGEFGSTDAITGELLATDADALQGFDLLTAIMHEQGHILGFEHNSQPGNIMFESLGTGGRIIPSLGEITESTGNEAGTSFLSVIEPFIAEVAILAGNNPSLSGFTPTNGQLLPIASNTALFSLVGTIYGGDGRTTFGVPNFSDRVVIHAGQGPGLTNYRLGQLGGSANTTLTTANLPAHTHNLNVMAPTLVVDTTDDVFNGDLTPGDISLREALTFIDDGGTITFDAALSGGTITLGGTELVVDKSVTIDGDLNDDEAPDITVSGGNASRVFNIDDGSVTVQTVNIDGLTITGGSTLSDGGGIYNQENLTLSNSTVSGNFASFEAGGINNFYGTLNISNSTVSGNSSNYGSGGGIVSRGTANISNSTVSGNSASSGGGIANIVGTANISNSTVFDNFASYGGGIFNFNNTTANISNSTVSGNSANSGGGIYNDVDGTANLASTIVADNTATTGNDLTNRSLVNASNSLIESGDAVNGTNVSNITGVDPLLDPSGLQDNGGPTQTIALQAGSPAIDAGSNPDSLPFDQRGDGFARVVNGTADIGAFEFVTPPPTELVVNTVTDENDGIGVGGISLRDALGAIADGGTITFDNSLTGNTVTLTNGELVVDKSVNIDGDTDDDDKADITISGNNASRVLNIDDGTTIAQTVNLESLTITGATVTLNGGGLLNQENLTLNNSTITGNTANFSGGGIFNSETATATINNSTLDGNTANFGGGGIYNNGGLQVSNSTLSGNTADSGGGIYNGRTVDINNSTINGNTAGDGGGIYNGGQGNISSSLISGNTATFSANEIYSNNQLSGDANNLFGDESQTNAQAFSYFSPGATDITATSDGTTATALNQILETSLRDNGGATPTLALVNRSPAIDAGNNSGSLSFDQRGTGFLREFGGGTDIGAFELNQPQTNQIPTVANEINDQTINTFDNFLLTVPSNTFEDLDNDVLSLSVNSLPDWLSFNEITQTFAGFPLSDDLGTTMVEVTADDGNGGMVSTTFELTVALPIPTTTNTVPGDAQANSLTGTTQNDLIDGKRGRDDISGASGDDYLLGGAAIDRISGDQGNDLIDGGLGDDLLLGRSGDDILLGGDGIDRLFGGPDNDILDGGLGNDNLAGNGGDDLLIGNEGNDELTGGVGSDLFFLSSQMGTDTIVDYEDGLDRFQLGSGLEFSQLNIIPSSGDVLIQVASTTEILATILTESSSNITAIDFI